MQRCHVGRPIHQRWCLHTSARPTCESTSVGLATELFVIPAVTCTRTTEQPEHTEHPEHTTDAQRQSDTEQTHRHTHQRPPPFRKRELEKCVAGVARTWTDVQPLLSGHVHSPWCLPVTPTFFGPPVFGRHLCSRGRANSCPEDTSPLQCRVRRLRTPPVHTRRRKRSARAVQVRFRPGSRHLCEP